MECKGSGQVRSEEEKKLGKMGRMKVECEICDVLGDAIGDHAGVYICARCHRDIVSPHIHD